MLHQKNLLLTFILCLLFAAPAVFAQTGSIRGAIKDGKTSEPLIGATVAVEGTTNGAITDINGNYVLPRVPVGKVNIVISFISYRTKKVEGVVVEPGAAAQLSTTLEEDVAQLQEVVVIAVREANTERAVIEEIRNSPQVVSGVSSEQIQRSMDRDAAQVMMRVPGITIQDGRFVMIRGVNERYNQVMINNAIAPSTEIDIRSFSFDLIPSNMLDRMLVFKSGSADMPGDFAGGVIKLFTQNTVNENFFNVSVGGGYRAGTTFRRFEQSRGSRTDFLGFDNGFRSLPSGFPSRLPENTASEEVFAQARRLTNNFVPLESNAFPDARLGMAFGRKLTIGGINASTLTSINYSVASQSYQAERNLYQAIDPVTQVSPPLFEYRDNAFERNIRLGLIHNWRLAISPRTTIEFRNLFNQIGDHETVLRNGTVPIQRPEPFQNYGYRYASRSIYSGQLQGTHKMHEGKSTLTWLVGGNYISRNEPDFRRFRTVRANVNDGPFLNVLPPGGSLFDNSRFFSKLNEYGLSHRLDFERKLGGDSANAITFQAGYFAEYRNRSFNARYLSYTVKSSTLNVDSIRALPIEQFFSTANIGRNRLQLEESTNASDSYSGTNLLTAGYASISLPLRRFYLSGGIRLEFNRQQLSSRDNRGQVIDVDNPILVPMPFLNLTYNLNKRSLARLAYGRTVNRPEFRELAPFLYYDFVNESIIFGNENLDIARIHNVDLRYEFYPRPGETISLAAFYKNFNRPIEYQLQVSSDGQQPVSFINADFANNVGLELEVRKSLSDIAATSFLRNLSLVLNASLIYSRVDLGNQALVQERVRALQGQSPYVINLAAFYDDPKRGFAVNAFYNVFGKRIFRVGSVTFPTVYEMPRNTLDVSVSKTLGRRITLKAGAQNILDAPFRFFQDSNRDVDITGVDELITDFRRGAQVSVGLGLAL